MAAQAHAHEAAHEVPDVDVGVGVEAHVDAAADRPDRPITRDARRAAAEIHVGEQRPEVQDEVGAVHAVDDRTRADRSDVDPHVEPVVHRKGALGEHRGRDRRAHALGELAHLALDLEAKRLDADHRERAARGVEPLGRFADRLLHLALVRATEGESPVPVDDLPRHRDPPLHHVAVDLEVARLLLAPHGSHDVVHALGRRVRVVEHARRTGELLVDAELRLDLLGLMVDEHAEPALLLARPSADHQHRHALGERAGDRVHHVVASGPVRDADDGEPPGGARVAVGGEADAGLVRERDDPEGAPFAEAQEEPDHQVARDAEEVRHADLLEVGDQEVAEGHRGAHRIPTRRTPRRPRTPRARSAPAGRERPAASPRHRDAGARAAGRTCGGRAPRHRRPRG